MEWTPIIDCAYDADFIIGNEALDVINVAIQLKDFAGNALTNRACIYAYMSDDEYGDSVAAGASTPDSVAEGTYGILEDIEAGKAFMLTSGADGIIDIDITEASGADTFYLVLVMANGKLVVSNAITFEA